MLIHPCNKSRTAKPQTLNLYPVLTGVSRYSRGLYEFEMITNSTLLIKAMVRR